MKIIVRYPKDSRLWLLVNIQQWPNGDGVETAVWECRGLNCDGSTFAPPASLEIVKERLLAMRGGRI